MKKRIYKGFIKKYQNVYLFITILFISGFLMGIFLSKYMELSDTNTLTSFINVITTSMDKYQYFVNEFFIGIVFILFVFLLGTSIIGIPLISLIIFSKGLQIGFSCTLFLATYQFKGILGICLTLFPQLLFDTLATFIISASAIQLSMYLMYSCISNQKIDSKKLLNNVLNDISISFIIVFIGSYLKATIVIELFKLFKLL